MEINKAMSCCRIAAIAGMLLTVPAFAQDDVRKKHSRQELSIFDLGTLPGHERSAAEDINDRLQIVGFSANTQEFRAFLWEDGFMKDLGTLPGAIGSVALGINNRGQVVGYSFTTQGQDAVLWQDGTMTVLELLPGFTTGAAFDINNRGQIVGVNGNPAGVFHAVLWHGDAVIDLGTLPGGHTSVAHAINNRRQIVGESFGTGDFHAVLWSHGALFDLGTLGADPSRATDINDRGQIVGFSSGDTTGFRAFLWEDGTMIDLGALPGSAPESFATAINRHGQIVGSSMPHVEAEPPLENEQHAILWEHRKMIDLGTFPGARLPSVTPPGSTIADRSSATRRRLQASVMPSCGRGSQHAKASGNPSTGSGQLMSRERWHR